jgi:hypothetical protein
VDVKVQFKWNGAVEGLQVLVNEQRNDQHQEIAHDPFKDFHP